MGHIIVAGRHSWFWEGLVNLVFIESSFLKDLGMYRVVNFNTIVPASSLKEAIAIKDSIGGTIYKKEKSSNDYN